MELLAPFHSIIAKSRTNMVARRKVNWICFAVTTFDTCANKCPSTNAKVMRMATVFQWNTICNASKEIPKVFAEFVNCERKHIDKTSKLCDKVTISKETELGEFCNKLQSYSQCYASVPFTCSRRANEVWFRINNAIQKSYNIILQLSSQHLRLPPECQNTMATMVPAGIVTSLMPPAVTKHPSTQPPRLTTPSPMSILTTIGPFYDWRTTVSLWIPVVAEDSSAMDDYSYFQQTVSYKYFQQQQANDNKALQKLEPVPAIAQRLDYWIDLDDAENSEPTGTDYSELHIDLERNDEMENKILNSDDVIDMTPLPTIIYPSTSEAIATASGTILLDSLTNAAICHCFLMFGTLAQIVLFFG